MPAQAWLPLLTTQVCLFFTAGLLRRWRASRRPNLASWAVALAFFALGAFCLWYGTAFGWSSPLLRLYYLGGALLGVPWLALGQLQLVVRRSTAGWLVTLVVVLTVVGGVLVTATPLRGPVASGRAVPDGTQLFTDPVRVVVALANSLGVLALVVGLVVGIVKNRRGSAAGRVRAGGLALVLAGALVAGSGGALSFLGRASANAAAVGIGLSLVYAGFLRAGTGVGRHRL